MNVSFKYEILKEIRGLERLLGLDNPANPSLFFKLVSGKYDVYIAGAPFYFGSIMTYFVARMLRKPFILFLEDVDYPVSLYKSRFDDFLELSFSRKVNELVLFIIRNSISQIILKHSDAYVVPGTATMKYLLHRNVEASRIFVAVNAVDNDAIEQECIESMKKGNVEKLRAGLNLENKKMVLSVAYLLERKGLQYLIQACGKLRKEDNNIALVIVGEGPYKRDLEKSSAQNDVDTIFTGYVPNLVDYYLAADVFVLPTLQDVWGFVINEAMVCGLPVITTKNAGASSDLVRNGINGYVVEPWSSSDLFRALKKILNDQQKTQVMRKASRDIIKGYSYEKSVHGFESAINYVTSSEIHWKHNE
jgi:glycosyltransferase involved in cell wall biosynthesis